MCAMVFSKAFFYAAVGMAFAVLEVEKGVSRRICWGGALLGVLGAITVTPDAHLPFLRAILLLCFSSSHRSSCRHIRFYET